MCVLDGERAPHETPESVGAAVEGRGRVERLVHQHHLAGVVHRRVRRTLNKIIVMELCIASINCNLGDYEMK